MLNHHSLLDVAIEEARAGLAEGGIPIGAALFDTRGSLLGKGHNRRVQEDDPSVHAETDAFRKAGRQQSYRDKIMVTTLAPCWYCSGLIRQFNIGKVIVGESENFCGGIDWLRENGIEVHRDACTFHQNSSHNLERRHRRKIAMEFKKEIIRSGVSFGTALAICISWSLNHSVLWAILHGFFSWFYVIYYLLFKG